MIMPKTSSGQYRIDAGAEARAGSAAVCLAVADSLIEATLLARRAASGLHDTRRYDDLISAVDLAGPYAA